MGGPCCVQLGLLLGQCTASLGSVAWAGHRGPPLHSKSLTGKSPAQRQSNFEQAVGMIYDASNRTPLGSASALLENKRLAAISLKRPLGVAQSAEIVSAVRAHLGRARTTETGGDLESGKTATTC